MMGLAAAIARSDRASWAFQYPDPTPMIGRSAGSARNSRRTATSASTTNSLAQRARRRAVTTIRWLISTATRSSAAEIRSSRVLKWAYTVGRDTPAIAAIAAIDDRSTPRRRMQTAAASRILSRAGVDAPAPRSPATSGTRPDQGARRDLGSARTPPAADPPGPSPPSIHTSPTHPTPTHPTPTHPTPTPAARVRYGRRLQRFWWPRARREHQDRSPLVAAAP
ncbi:hypothetical protein FAGKG844_220021 [Frankia sp. AgKG'84/4]